MKEGSAMSLSSHGRGGHGLELHPGCLTPTAAPSSTPPPLLLLLIWGQCEVTHRQSPAWLTSSPNRTRSAFRAGGGGEAPGVGGEGSARQTLELFLTEEREGLGPEDPPSPRLRAWLVVDSIGVIARSRNCRWTGLWGPGMPDSETCPLLGHSAGGHAHGVGRSRARHVNTPASAQQAGAFSGARGPREMGLEPRVSF